MEAIRLSKLMAQQGLCSRREADEYIKNGWVLVDGHVIDKLGTRVLPAQSISLRSEATLKQHRKFTVILNKPVGYVSGTPEKNYKPAAMLIVPRNCVHRLDKDLLKQPRADLAPAGRLDIESQGLLVLTQDGRIARLLIGPQSELEKEYLIRFQGDITARKLALLAHGLRLDGRALKPARVQQINESQLRIILKEGRKRQIRRMCELVDLTVLKLQRVRIGNVRLGSLPLGKWRMLQADETF